MGAKKPGELSQMFAKSVAAGDLDGERTGIDDQNALADLGMAQDPVNRQPPPNHQQEGQRK